MKYSNVLASRNTWFALAAVLALSTGCDNSVDPFIETDRYFTIFGYLDTASDTQFVRVIPFRRDLGGTAVEKLDVEVTATVEETGETHEWRDSVITYRDGSVGHVFFSPFRPVPGRRYTFRVERPDGAATWAETVVPPAEDVEVTELPLSATPPITQVVTWEDIEAEPFRVEVWYRFSEFPPTEPFTDIVLTYEDIGRPLADSSWEVRVMLSDDLEEIDPRVRPGSPLLGIGMRLTMSDDAWRPPGGVFNREVLVQPGTFSNVEHGFGFFGSVNQYTVEWVLDPLILARLGVAAPR